MKTIHFAHLGMLFIYGTIPAILYVHLEVSNQDSQWTQSLTDVGGVQFYNWIKNEVCFQKRNCKKNLQFKQLVHLV